MRFLLAITIALFLSSSFALPNANFAAEHESIVALNETFVSFTWKGVEAYAKESFDVHVKTPTRIQIVDYQNRGDMFEVFDNGKSLGTTTKVSNQKDQDLFASVPEEAILDERFSKGTFDLTVGEHKITIKAIGPYESGTAAIRLLDQTSAVGFYKKVDSNDGGDEKEDGDDEESKNKGKGREHKKNDWKDMKPTSEDIDLDHTITLTKTMLLYQKPTYVSIVYASV